MKLESVYENIQPRIYAFFLAKTSNRQLAEDLTQEVFYEAVKGMGTFNNGSTLETWLFAIAKNRLKKHIRSQTYQRRLKRLLTKEERFEVSPEESLLLKEKQSLVLQQINTLDDMAREIVILRVYGALSFKEIGQLVNQTETYTRVTFHRAKLKLQKEMEDYDG
ncbi:RNA polymerase sigma factor [Lentibacillus saliphilus]|uniref:RNA polymerase sigma factor n=1 Tax=Lentibacillus saliphilus TaxID=2737028 RepID=UPI001C30A16F|nr:RNA polymerase sigma factor [Lentibacillus saliphilus]